MTKYYLKFFIYCILSSLTLGAQGATVTLIDTIAVEAPHIHLGSIATVETGDAALTKRLSSLVVGEAPSLNQSRLISAYKIRALLKRQGFSEVEVRGHQSIVNTLSREISREELKQVINEWVQKQNSADQEIEIQFISLPKVWKIPAGKGCEISLSKHSRHLAGNCSLTMQALCGGRSYATARARLDLEVYQEALVMVRPLKKGEKLTASHVEKRRSPVTNSTGMEIVHIESMLDMEAKRDLAVGHQPNIRDFNKPITIGLGSHNRIIVINGNLNLRLDGAIALEDGREGENILFRNPMNKREPLRAQVVRPGLAVIHINQVTRM